jgi:hypothetical protein
LWGVDGGGLFVGKYLIFETLEVMLERLAVGKCLWVMRLKGDRDKGGGTNKAFPFEARGSAADIKKAGKLHIL